MTKIVPEYPSAAAVTAIGNEVASLMKRGRREAALRYAMVSVEPLLVKPDDVLRLDLRERVFKQFANSGVSYQGNDFEAVDYQQYELSPDLPLIRGPRVPDAALERGEYFCVLGAAQTLGRLARQPWPNLLSDALGLPVLNLGRGGVGPDFYLSPEVLPFIQNARFVVLQVMSGRSVGCDEFPGGRRIKGRFADEKENRVDILERLWKQDPNLALGYVRRWNENYLSFYRLLAEQIQRPTLLVWISSRQPKGWSPETLLTKFRSGSFPQLIGEEIFEGVAALFDDRLLHIRGQSHDKPVSRVTGHPCPYFGSGKSLKTEMNYYPSIKHHVELADAMRPWATAAALEGKSRSR